MFNILKDCQTVLQSSWIILKSSVAVYRCSNFYTILPSLLTAHLIYYSQCSGYKVVSHCAWFVFPWWWMLLDIFSCAFCTFVCLLGWNAYSVPVPILSFYYWVILFFIYSRYKYLIRYVFGNTPILFIVFHLLMSWEAVVFVFCLIWNSIYYFFFLWLLVIWCHS